MSNDQEPDGEFKFQNCKHRSPDQKSVFVKRCPCQGGDYIDIGYECVARKIFKVTPEVCQYCHMFEQK